jgi:hypothetical protein
MRQCLKPVAAQLLFFLFCGCSTLPVGSSVPDRPEWIDNPKSNDSVYMYRVGHASGRSTSEEARKAAFEDALARISKSIISSVSVRGRETRLSSMMEIRDAKILPGCIYLDRSGSKHDAWVQVMYPLSEKKKIVDRIDMGEKLNGMWVKAQSDMHRGAYADAVPSLTNLLARFEQAVNLSFDVDNAKILLGDAYRDQKNFLEARRWYENVEKLSENDDWRKKAAERMNKLPEPPRFWPMNDRFGGRKTALLCATREGGDCKRAKDMISVLAGDCREARLKCMDITTSLTPKNMADVFDVSSMEPLIKAVEGKDVGIVIAVLFDIDPVKRRKNNDAGGIPSIDTQVRFLIVSISAKTGAEVLYSGNFKEIAGKASDSRLASHAAAILIRNYLVPNCPSVK